MHQDQNGELLIWSIWGWDETIHVPVSSPPALYARCKMYDPNEQRAKINEHREDKGKRRQEKNSAAFVGGVVLCCTLLSLMCVARCYFVFSEQVRAQALSLVQDWGIAFQTDMSLAYAETYGR